MISLIYLSAATLFPSFLCCMIHLPSIALPTVVTCEASFDCLDSLSSISAVFELAAVAIHSQSQTQGGKLYDPNKEPPSLAPNYDIVCSVHRERCTYLCRAVEVYYYVAYSIPTSKISLTCNAEVF